jgi:hypothetical protein
MWAHLASAPDAIIGELTLITRMSAVPALDSMRIRRYLLIPLIVLLIAAGIALIVVLRKQAPPEAARLLPGADGFFYINLKWIRTFNATGQLPPVSREPEYQKFVEETGFQFERDLDKAAFAVHYPQSWGDGTAGSATDPRFSEVFVGKFDSGRMTAYLKKLSSSIEDYGGFDIYSIPLEGRTVRVVILSYDSVAVSNHPNPAVIRGMLDRSRKLASPFGGPWLLRRYYRHVPLASLSFAILRVTPEASAFGGLGSWSLLFPKPAVTVISARYIRALHLRAEAFTDSPDDAHAVTEKTSAFLSLFHAAESSIGTQGTDPDVKTFFDSLKVEQSGDRAILTASLPAGFFRKVLTEVSPETLAPMQRVPAVPPPKQTPNPTQPQKPTAR